MLEAALQDLRFAARALRQQPAWSAAVVATLALGVGAATAIFSVFHGVLLRPLPYPRPDRLVAVCEVNHAGACSRLADPNFADFRDQSRSFQALAKYQSGVVAVAGVGEPTRTVAAAVSRDFFRVLGVAPVLGRGFLPEDARPGAAPVLLASDRYWKQQLGSSRELAAFEFRIEDRIYAVVGILPEGFAFPAQADLWLPAELDPENTSRTSHNYQALGRLADGVSVAQASRDLELVAARIVRESAEQGEYLLRSAAAVPLQASLTGRLRAPLSMLLGAVGFLLLVACANVALLLLARASGRGRELAVRRALGAGRGRLLRQFVTETLLLAGVSLAAGMLVALGMLRGLLALAPPELPRLGEVGIRWPALAFAAGTALVIAAGLGVLTALRASALSPSRALVEGGRGQSAGPRRNRVGRALVAAQLALTLALLTGAGLLGRSLLGVLAVDPGFRTGGVVALELELPQAGGPTPGAERGSRARLSQRISGLVERLRAIPGVQEAAAASALPLQDGGLPDGMFLLVSPEENPGTFAEYEALAKQQERRGVADYCAASPGYFQALGVPLVRGRVIDERDGFDAPHVAVISASLARARWPGRDAVGQTIQFGNMDGDLQLLTIVGVVGDTRQLAAELPPRPTVFVNLLQRPRSRLSLVLHGEADPAGIVAAARAITRQAAPDSPLRVRSFAEIFGASLGARRFNLTLVASFALTALALAVTGVYGVAAYGVVQRTREIGVRLALGARSSDVLRLILGQGLATALSGVAAGVAGSFATARALQSLLFGVPTTDPLTFAAVTALLVAVAGLACYLPARRAAMLDPARALRDE